MTKTRALRASAQQARRSTQRRSLKTASRDSDGSAEHQEEPSAGEREQDQGSAGTADGSPPSYLQAPETFLDSYRVTHNEVGVLTVEPYKSLLLPQWRFKTAAIARESAAALFERFEAYGAAGDFVGMDMARKFIQMGMTRAKRYANYKGGRKYEPVRDGKPVNTARDGSGKGRQIEKSAAHEGKAEKELASAVFREYWERCKADERYAELKEEFLDRRKRAQA